MGSHWRSGFGWLGIALALGVLSPLARAQDTAAAGGSPGSDSAAAGDSPSDTGGGSGGDEGPSISDSNVGYIDPALPGNIVRFRYDNAHGNNRPTRGTFFYAKQGLATPVCRFPSPMSITRISPSTANACSASASPSSLNCRCTSPTSGSTRTRVAWPT